jgi:hypothetical protein
MKWITEIMEAIRAAKRAARASPQRGEQEKLIREIHSKIPANYSLNIKIISNFSFIIDLEIRRRRKLPYFKSKKWPIFDNAYW